MNEDDFYKKYRRIYKNITVYETIEEIPEDDCAEWIVLDWALYSKDWGDD
jgi:uncharacterized membrane protein